MNFKKLFYLFITIFIVGTLFGYSVKDQDSPPGPSKIIALPANYNPLEVITPYSGDHPSRLTRPEETFNFPIKIGETGPVNSLFAGPLEYPFLCQTDESRLGQPLIDNHKGEGIRVYQLNKNGEKTSEVLGYSKDCSIPTQAYYMYKSTEDERFHLLDDAKNDIAKLNLNGRVIDYIVRVEVGTINRHLYLIYALRGNEGSLQKPDSTNWNKRLIFQFKGGVGIGKRQGKMNIPRLLNRRQEQLESGYAIIYSTANQTSNHYNIWLSEDSALRVKKQFIALYGKPEYTVGFGGSGGAIQQYLLAQNHPGIIDAALTLYSYPDMISQTTYVLDCELLEYFFDVTDQDNDKWSDWENRRFIEGLNAKNDMFNRYTVATALSDILKFKIPKLSMGMSECVKSWRGLTPLIINPLFPIIPERISQDVQSKIQLNYWDNLKTFYGTDSEGYARVTWDNVGVQYGLDALKKGQINTATFLKLNSSIGGWKHVRDMKKENFWFLTDDFFPSNFSVWSHQNSTSDIAPEKYPAPRKQGDIKAIQAAYLSGQIFLGKIDIPVLDLRHYLDSQLDMHHSFASFSTRSRMLREQGHADNQVILMTRKPHTPLAESLVIIDKWMDNIKTNPQKSVVENKPKNAIHSCYDEGGNLIAEGPNVWDGDWNNKAKGQCMSSYPSYQTSRMIAGDDIAGDIFKCELQPVQQAVVTGLYGPVDMSEKLSQLETIFPTGVCDYSKPDAGRPLNLSSGNLPKTL